MLQRAASNAYSWWWASHVRTKQSKWLEQNLQDLEEKVGYTLKLIEEDGDSFAKRAEMYYKKRPELISFVEEAYRAYRALAERYDHISTELQNANNTIAAVFPEKVQFMEEDDEDTSPRVKKRSDIQKGNIPSVPKAPTKDLKNVITTATKKLRTSRSRKAAATVAKSGLSKAEGLEEIGKLQKNILALQTQKEFVKSSYEDKLAKYWDIDNQIREMQGRIYTLQDDFGAGIVIEDDDARSLMASTALKSCEETLTQLQEKHGRSAGEAKAEHKSIKNSQEKSESIKDEFLDNETSQKRPYAKDDSVKAVDGSTTEGGEESEASQEKIKEDFEVGSNDSLTVSEMAEKIDELVNKVLSLDTAFLSQTSFLQRLQTENDKLQRQIPVLEDEKAMLINSKNELSNKLVMMEETLHRLQCLNSNVNDHNNNFQTFSCEAHSPPLNAEKLRSLKPDKELQHSSQKEDKSSDQGKLQEVDGQEGVLNPNDGPNGLQTEKLPEEKLEQTMNVPKEKPGEELQNSSQKDDRSAVQGKVQEVDGQEGSLNHDDGPNRPQTVKLLVEKPDEELQHVSQKEDKSTIQGKLQKVDGQEGATDANDRSYKLPTVKLPEEKPDEELQYSSQKEDKFTVQVKLQEVDGQEGVLNPNDGANGLQNVTLPEEKSDEKLQHSSQKEDKSTVQGKLQEVDEQEGALKPNDGPNILELVKLSMEKSNEELQHSSQKEDESTIQDNLHQIDRQGVAVNPNDGPNVLQNVKIPRKVEVKHSSENNKTPQKEEMSAVQVNSQKEIDEQKGEMDSNHGLQRRQSLKLPEEHEIQSSSKQEETSAVKDRSQKRFEGSECAPNLADDKQHRAKPNEELKVSSSIQKEEKAIDAETEVANHTKEHDLYTMPGNEGEVFSPSQSNVEPSNILEKIPDQMTQQKVDNQASSQAPNNSPNFEREEQLTEQGHEPDREKKLNVMENREKALLTEYMKILQNYTELKKKLDEEGIQTSEDKETAENNSEITVQLEEMRSDNARKDEEIRVLREKLSILQAGTDGNNKLDNQWAEQKVTVIETPRTQPSEEEQDIKVIPLEQSQTTSAIEEKFRISIDELLEENLDFWLRFSGTFHQIQKFETEVKDLEAEVSKVQDKKKHSESSSIKYSLKSDIRPLYNHLREIQTELTLWMEKSALLKEELTARFSSLCDIQEEITRALRLSAEDYDFKFTSFQAAKFQGEVLNMKQENNKVADELQAGLDHVTTLQIDLEKTLTSLSEEFGFSDAKSGPNIKLERSDSRNRVPLRSFIFGVKPKKPKSSFLSSMHPALARKYNGFRSGLNR